MTKQRQFLLFFSLLFVIGVLAFVKTVLAVDTGTNEINGAIQLSGSDPRAIASRIINIAMMFLGVLAVGIMVLAGFKWTSSAGNEEKITEAKNMLRAGAIGLAIVLASWGIALFVLGFLNKSVANPGDANDPINCPGGNCQIIPCSGPGCAGASCDDNSLTIGCQAGACQAGLSCSPVSCTCVPCTGPNCSQGPGDFGEACNNDVSGATCQPNDQACDSSQGLKCDPDSCTCLGQPVITGISPQGNFCQGDLDKACLSDGDCAGSGPCNINNPNGTANNFLTISGYNFGNLATSSSSWGNKKLIFLGDAGDASDDKEGVDPSVVNGQCLAVNSWSNNEITVAIPDNAPSGPLEVINGDLLNNNFDISNDASGPKFDDFKYSSIKRPGVCRLEPSHGLLGDQILLFGTNLLGQVYFGNLNNKFLAPSTSLNGNGLSGDFRVPNINSGRTSVFVLNSGAQTFSNSLDFYKDKEPAKGPAISSFEPKSGPASQYVTISGTGFKSQKGQSTVYFSGGGGDLEADYSFPAACLRDVWTDNQIIVKVPKLTANGNYSLKIKIEGQAEIISKDYFAFNSATALLPSLCKVEPAKGPANSLVSLYGEYFGENNQLAIARFYNTQDIGSTIALENGAQKIAVRVPQKSLTGPVAVVKNNQIGNGLNFLVGSCSSNNDCGGASPLCCPKGSPKAGQCAASLFDSQNGCYLNIFHSVYQWGFDTAIYSSCDSDPSTAACEADNQRCGQGMKCDAAAGCTCVPCSGVNCGGLGQACGSTQTGKCQPNNKDCQSGLTCDALTCKCAQPFYSCEQKGSTSGSCPTGFCPNSPGQCSPYAGGAQKVVGTCDSSCNSIKICNKDLCTLDKQLNRCVASGTCDLATDFSYTLGTKEYKTTKFCNAQKKWQIKVSGSCPSNWKNLGGGVCVSDNETCDICDTGFTCLNNEGRGVCVAPTAVCPSGSTCDGSQCLAEDKASCSCCCEIGQDARDCCAPLKCKGTCGSDTSDDGAGFGKCGGCFSAGNNSSTRDAACNCSTSSGKFCQADNSDGVCQDCTTLKNATDCADHASTCCWDDKENNGTGLCRGVVGNIKFTDNTKPNYGHCAYLGCGDGTSVPTTSCNSSASAASIYNLNQGFIYKTEADCSSGCKSNNNTNYICATKTDEGDCRATPGCCFDEGAKPNVCRSGDKISDPNSPDKGKCAYYSCQTGVNKDKCDLANPQTTGLYKTQASCTSGCQNPKLGSLCSTNIFDPQAACSASSCGAPFGCFQASGASGATPDCGFCCCDPSKKGSDPLDLANYDACRGLNLKLSCQANKTPCSGGGRGLCCGCQADSECGNNLASGCATDSCCHARPTVLADQTIPRPDSENICRNAAISIPFDSKMDNRSLASNIILLEKHKSGATCPAGSYKLTDANNSSNLVYTDHWWKRIINKIVKSLDAQFKTLARFVGVQTAWAIKIDPSENATYCVIPGSINAEVLNGQTIASLVPGRLLTGDTEYFVVVRGPSDINNTKNGQSGVMSFEGVSLSGLGLYQVDPNKEYFYDPSGQGLMVRLTDTQSFYNSHIFRFKTLKSSSANSGLCVVDRVSISPSTYLFNKNTNDLSENDIEPADKTFDTVSDRDRVFSAHAVAKDGQILVPTSNYSWTWNFSIADPKYLSFINVAGFDSSKKLVKVEGGVSDKATYLTASLKMDTKTNIISTPDKDKTIPIKVFVCSNPWPPLVNNDFWQPAKDTDACNAGGGACNNFNYEFYYCRDAGDPNSTLDDLPPLSSGQEIISIGRSSRKVCSNDKTIECKSNLDCPNPAVAVCLWDILKESYLFKKK